MMKCQYIFGNFDENKNLHIDDCERPGMAARGVPDKRARARPYSRPAHQIPIRIPAPAAGFPEKFWRTGWPTPRQPAKSQGEHRTNVRIDANGRARARHRLLGRTRSRIRKPRQGWDSRRGFLLCDISIKNLSSVVHQVRVLAVL